MASWVESRHAARSELPDDTTHRHMPQATTADTRQNRTPPDARRGRPWPRCGDRRGPRRRTCRHRPRGRDAGRGHPCRGRHSAVRRDDMHRRRHASMRRTRDESPGPVPRHRRAASGTADLHHRPAHGRWRWRPRTRGGRRARPRTASWNAAASERSRTARETRGTSERPLSRAALAVTRASSRRRGPPRHSVRTTAKQAMPRARRIACFALSSASSSTMKRQAGSSAGRPARMAPSSADGEPLPTCPPGQPRIAARLPATAAAKASARTPPAADGATVPCGGRCRPGAPRRIPVPAGPPAGCRHRNRGPASRPRS